MYGERLVLTRQMLPLALAFAITIHKSQVRGQGLPPQLALIARPPGVATARDRDGGRPIARSTHRA
jgi:hypothetical protein